MISLKNIFPKKTLPNKRSQQILWHSIAKLCREIRKKKLYVYDLSEVTEVPTSSVSVFVLLSYFPLALVNKN